MSEVDCRVRSSERSCAIGVLGSVAGLVSVVCCLAAGGAIGLVSS